MSNVNYIDSVRDYLYSHLRDIEQQKREHLERYGCVLNLEIVIPARLFDPPVSATFYGLPVVEQEAAEEGQRPFVRCRCER